NLHPRSDPSVAHADVSHHAAVIVVFAVEDQRLEGRVGLSRGGGNALDERLEDALDADRRLAAHHQHVAALNSQHGVHFVEHFFGADDGEIDLVDAGDYDEIGVDGSIGV